MFPSCGSHSFQNELILLSQAISGEDENSILPFEKTVFFITVQNEAWNVNTSGIHVLET